MGSVLSISADWVGRGVLAKEKRPHTPQPPTNQTKERNPQKPLERGKERIKKREPPLTKKLLKNKNTMRAVRNG